MTMVDLDEALRGIFASDPETLADTAPVWNRLREEAPFHWHEPYLIVSRYTDVKDLLGDDYDRFTGSGLRVDSTYAQSVLARLDDDDRERFLRLVEFDGDWMSRTTDGERHARRRRIAHRAFTPRRIAEVRSAVERYTDELLDEAEQHDVPDLMELAYQLPLMVIADMLGVSHEDRRRIHEWTSAIGASLQHDVEGIRAGVTAVDEFRGYIDGVVDRHKRDPESVSPLVASMLDAEEGERLNAAELTAMFANLLFAGHETTTNLISLGLVELLRHPEQWRLLCADQSLAAGASEELLRYVTPVQYITRNAARELELGGARVAEGQTVLLVYAAANRDPRVFDDPDRLDITRRDSRHHLALGFGPRFCLGASLARLEGEVAFRALSRRFPDVSLTDEELEWRGPPILRRLTRLPVRLAAPAQTA